MSTVRGPGAAPGRSNVTAPQTQATTTHTPAATTPPDTTAQAPAPAPKKDGYAQSPDVSGRQRAIGSDAQITGETPTVQANPALQGDVSAARASAQAATRQASKAEVHGHSHDHEHHTHGKGGGGKTDLGDKFKYDTVQWNNGTVNKPLDSALRAKDQLPHVHKQLDEQLAKQFPGGVEFKPPFKDPQGPESADAKFALLNGVNNEKGSHQDKVVDLNGTKNMISVDTDKAGKASVTMHGPGTPGIPATSTFTDPAKAKAALEADFGVKVSDKPKAFTAEEMSKTHAAFSKMSPDEQKALKGVTLKRVNGFSDPNRAAEFDWSYKTDRNGKPSRTDELRIGDRTFNSDGNSFVGNGKAGGSVPPSLQTITHEAGHAVDSKKYRDGLYNKSAADYAFKQNEGDVKKAQGSYAKAAGGVKDKSLSGFDAAQAGVTKATSALATAKPADVAQKKQDLDAAIAKRDAELAKLPDTNPAKAAAKTYAGAQDKHADLARASGTATTEKADGTSANGKQSKRLENFEKFVKDNNIKSPTDYGTNASAEHFAEAYSLYKTDPEYLKANNPKLFDYFETNQHL